MSAPKHERPPQNAEAADTREPGKSADQPTRPLFAVRDFIRTHSMTPAEAAVLRAFMERAGPDGKNAHPGIDGLMKATKFSETSCWKAVVTLRRRGWIVRTARGNPLKGTADVYSLGEGVLTVTGTVNEPSQARSSDRHRHGPRDLPKRPFTDQGKKGGGGERKSRNDRNDNGGGKRVSDFKPIGEVEI